MKLKELMEKASSNNFLEAEQARGILTDHFIVTYMDLVEALEEMTRNGRKQGWWDNYEPSMERATQALERANNVEVS